MNPKTKKQWDSLKKNNPKKSKQGRKRVVKAWALIIKPHIYAAFTAKGEAHAYRENGGGLHGAQIVPCTISYQLPNKKKNK